MTKSIEPTSTEQPFDRGEFWREHSVADLFANARPLREDESFAIEDLTEDEWEPFWAAINE